MDKVKTICAELVNDFIICREKLIQGVIKLGKVDNLHIPISLLIDDIHEKFVIVSLDNGKVSLLNQVGGIETDDISVFTMDEIYTILTKLKN